MSARSPAAKAIVGHSAEQGFPLRSSVQLCIVVGDPLRGWVGQEGLRQEGWALCANRDTPATSLGRGCPSSRIRSLLVPSHDLLS